MPTKQALDPPEPDVFGHRGGGVSGAPFTLLIAAIGRRLTPWDVD